MVVIVMFVVVLSVLFDHEHQDCTVFTFSLNVCISAVNEHRGQYGMEKPYRTHLRKVYCSIIYTFVNIQTTFTHHNFRQ